MIDMYETNVTLSDEQGQVNLQLWLFELIKSFVGSGRDFLCPDVSAIVKGDRVHLFHPLGIWKIVLSLSEFAAEQPIQCLSCQSTWKPIRRDQ